MTFLFPTQWFRYCSPSKHLILPAPFGSRIFQQGRAIRILQGNTILMGIYYNYSILRRSSLQQGSPSKHLMPSAPFGSRIFQQGRARLKWHSDSTILSSKANIVTFLFPTQWFQYRSPSKHLMPSAPFGSQIFQQGKRSLHPLSPYNSIPKGRSRKYMGTPRLHLYGRSTKFQTFPPYMTCN